MILTDAGPLIALIDRSQRDHGACVAALGHLTGPMLTTWPAYTEAMYLLGSVGSWTAQDVLWRWLLRGDVEIGSLDAGLVARARALMEKYRDLPMDLADATLVALGEDRQLATIFTLDSHFAIYRLRGTKRFVLIPEQAAPRSDL